MQHPDEGFIHAWLDGGLAADDAARIEAHVAQCAACQSQVAEARGLIAASSRIVASLDATPGGVIPSSGTLATHRARRRVPWLGTPWRAAIAATLVAAFGLYGVRQIHRDSGSSIDLPREAVRTTDTTAPLTKPTAPGIANTPADRNAGSLATTQTPVKSPGIQIPRVAAPTADRPTVSTSKEPERVLASRSVASSAAKNDTAVATSSTNKVDNAAANSDATKAATAAATADATKAASASPPIATPPAPTRAAAGQGRAISGARGGGRGVRRPGMAATPSSAALAPRLSAAEVMQFVGCYNLSASTYVLPRRFALSAEPWLAPDATASAAPAARRNQVRYVDSTNTITGPKTDAGWTVENGHPTISTTSYGALISLTVADSTVSASSPAGERTGSHTNCGG
jgi:hypothetical protein